jgi:hypothetical protein
MLSALVLIRHLSKDNRPGQRRLTRPAAAQVALASGRADPAGTVRDLESAPHARPGPSASHTASCSGSDDGAS